MMKGCHGSKLSVVIAVVCSMFCPIVAEETSSLPRTSKEQLQNFKVGIDKIIAMTNPYANVGIEIVSLKNGFKLYQKNPHHLFVPAGALKLITGAAALDSLGVSYRFLTTLWTDGQIEDKQLVGNLYLKGSGDPQLTVKDLEGLIIELKQAGVEEITGSIFVDNTDFDGIAQGPGWMWDDEPEYWNSPMDALTVNHSCLKLWVKPAQQSASPAKIFIHPKTAFVRVQNFSKTSESPENTIAVSRRTQEGENWIQIKGSIGQASRPLAYEVALEQPHLYAGHVFKDLLAKQKIVCQGEILEKAVPDEALLLAEHESCSLNLIVQKMMKENDNLYADCLFKKVGQNRFGTTGTWKTGSQAVREFLMKKAAIDTSELVILDGSGLSRYNLLSAHQFTQFLVEMKQDFSIYSDFLASLPIAGVDGDLKDMLPDEELTSKIRAQAGISKGVRSLFGYAVTQDGEELAFSIMINGLIESSQEKPALEKEICKFLATYSK